MLGAASALLFSFHRVTLPGSGYLSGKTMALLNGKAAAAAAAGKFKRVCGEGLGFHLLFSTQLCGGESYLAGARRDGGGRCVGSLAAPRGPVSSGGEAGRARSLAEDVGCGSTGWRGRGGLCAPPILPVVPEIFFVEDPGDESSIFFFSLEMEAEDLSGRELTIDSIMNKVRDIKNKFKNEDLTDELSLNKVSADTTDNSGTVNQIMMMANNPEDWLNLLLKLEKNSVPLNDALLNKLIGRYNQAIEALPPDKYGQNESFARIQVRFAELKAIQEPDDARDYFQMARANCKKFAFVHISFAQFELSQGNFKKSKQLLHKAVECGAVPGEMLEIAIRNLNLQKKQLLSEEEKKSLSGDFPDGAVVKNPPANAGDTGSSPGPGRSHMPRSKQISGSECRDTVVSGSKSSGNDSSDLRHLTSVKNIRSKEPLMSDEKSSELVTDSVTLKNKSESSLLTKLEETKEHHEPKVPESNQKQWPSKRKSECVNQNPAASSNQWQISEIISKADTEQKQTSFEQPALSVSKQSPPISTPKWIDPKSICKTPSNSVLDDYMSW
ncbi:hypothetical protein J1605_015005 [Eschrichtius robustus]|uniref:Dual specificity protein kinase TTK n=1 Tax=Eschrichtius robustus TaxID=9764 RepID=A0AB34GAS3_ESCRO|nr:hypothetical protein J1605_015005 [Eschrichtius robustus]